ncbi:unnamed protein product [Rhizoctonia solani]|nr:unnamed protein product [Rhizoctonia solani]
MAHHSEWYPPGQVCSPPELTTYLKNVYDLKPIIGLPSDSEVVGIHDVMHAAKKASDVPGMHNPSLILSLSDHLFSVQMVRYRNKYFITLPSDTIYTPPIIPVHVSAKLQPVSGVPTDDDIMGVQDAVQTYQEMRRFPSMFDPHVNMELSQHLFDLQMGESSKVHALCERESTERAQGNIGSTRIPTFTDEKTTAASNNAGMGANPIDSPCLSHSLPAIDIHESVKGLNQVVTREVITSDKWNAIQNRESVNPVLVFGRFGSAKASLIDTACTQMEIEPSPALSSSDISVQCTVVDDHPFKLINTPGFDNPQKSNLEVFLDIAQYLQSGDLNPGVKGIIYVHHAGDSLQSRALMENLNVLFNVLLGHSALRLLRILVIPSHSTETEHCASTVVKMQTSDPVFSPAYKAGASISTSSLDEASVFDILKEVLTNDFVQLQIQCKQPPNLRQAIEEALGYSDANSVKAALAHREDSMRQKYLPDLVATRKKLDAAQKA